MNVKAKKVLGYDEAKNQGDFFFSNPGPAEDGMMRLSFLCPCGCGDLCGVRVREDGRQVSQSVSVATTGTAT